MFEAIRKKTGIEPYPISRATTPSVRMASGSVRVNPAGALFPLLTSSSNRIELLELEPIDPLHSEDSPTRFAPHCMDYPLGPVISPVIGSHTAPETQRTSSRSSSPHLLFPTARTVQAGSVSLISEYSSGERSCPARRSPRTPPHLLYRKTTSYRYSGL